MTPDLHPVTWAHRLREWGSDDPAFDSLMAAGPVVVLVLAFGGRTVLTTALVALYVTGFFVALARNVVSDRGTELDD